MAPPTRRVQRRGALEIGITSHRPPATRGAPPALSARRILSAAAREGGGRVPRTISELAAADSKAMRLGGMHERERRSMQAVRALSTRRAADSAAPATPSALRGAPVARRGPRGTTAGPRTRSSGAHLTLTCAALSSHLAPGRSVWTTVGRPHPNPLPSKADVSALEPPSASFRTFISSENCDGARRRGATGGGQAGYGDAGSSMGS